MNQLVSIIMPAYNAERFIAQAIDSVYKQTYTDWELIIIDDGSTDFTGKIVKPWLIRDPRIIYYYQQNAKQGCARNMGLQLSHGNLVAFLDSDDLWLPERLSLMVDEFESGTQDLLFSDAYVFKGNFNLKNIPSGQNRFFVPVAQYFGDSGLNKFLESNRIPMLTTLIKKEILIDTGLFSDRAVCEDYEMWLKLLMRGYKFRSVDLPLAAYRIHGNSTTSTDRIATDHCIDVIYHLKAGVTNQKYHDLLNISLVKWYLMKLNYISNSIELMRFLESVRLHEVWNRKLWVVSKARNSIFFHINKKLIGLILRQFKWPTYQINHASR